MIKIDAGGSDFRELNEKIRAAEGDCEVVGCLGQRFIGAGMAGKTIRVRGISGNALGAYLNGATILTDGNAQDAVGDTMNAGKIVIRGDVGDAAGYAMRGGAIFVKGNAGYRAGIHMKEYREKIPVLVIGGRTGSFLGEYQAGGRMIVLGLHADGKPVVGNFPCMGMHGGKLYLRSDCKGVVFPERVHTRPATEEDLNEIQAPLEEFAERFGYRFSDLIGAPFTVAVPDSKNPYKQMYVAN